MRVVFLSMLLASLAQPALAVGTRPKEVSSPKALKPSDGAVIVSVRSEIYLPEALEVYFLREGGSVDKSADVISFVRKHNYLAMSNTSTGFATRALKVVPGRYRLVGHGMNCPSVPPPGMICSVSISMNGMGGGRGIPRPSRGYAGVTPVFEVIAGKVTNVGDLILCDDNFVRMTALPATELIKMSAKVGGDAGPAPIVPDEFVMKRAARVNGMFDNIGRQY